MEEFMAQPSLRHTSVACACLLAIASLPVLAAGASAASTQSLVARDFGLNQEESLQSRAEALFGFERTVEFSANTPSNTAPGDQAVEVAGGLNVRVMSSKVGENADMIALWPDNAHPTHAIICNEIDGTVANAPASVQRVRLSDGQVEDMVFGMTSCDPARRTSWGTIVVGEEAGTAGRLWEILDPLNVNGVTVDRAQGTSSDPDHVVARMALGQLSFEGIVLLADG